MFDEDSEALFDVFDSEVPISEFTTGELSSGTDHTAEKKKNINKQQQLNVDQHSKDQANKRSLQETESTNVEVDTDYENGNMEEDGSAHPSKKFKGTDEAPQPIVADEFEQESTREVANIPGLQSSTDADNHAGVILSHQVSVCQLSILASSGMC
jgi:hypothetical protein